MTKLNDIYFRLKNAPQIEDMDSAISDLGEFLTICDKLPTPLFYLLIVKQIEMEEQKGALIESENKKICYGIVIKKGAEVQNVSEGDKIAWFADESGEEMNFGGEAFMVMNLPQKTLIL